MKSIIFAFLSGVIIGYLINKITSLVVLIVVVILVAGYFLPGSHSSMIYTYIGDIITFIKNYVQTHNIQNPITNLLNIESILSLAFMAGVVVGFKIN